MRAVQCFQRRPADKHFGSGHIGTSQLELTKVLAHIGSGELVGSLSGCPIMEDTNRLDRPVADVEREVADKTWLLTKRGSELFVDAMHQHINRTRTYEIPPYAGVHHLSSKPCKHRNAEADPRPSDRTTDHDLGLIPSAPAKCRVGPVRAGAVGVVGGERFGLRARSRKQGCVLYAAHPDLRRRRKVWPSPNPSDSVSAAPSGRAQRARLSGRKRVRAGRRRDVLM